MPRDGADDKKSPPSVDSEGFTAVGRGGKPLKPSGSGEDVTEAAGAAGGTGMAGSPQANAAGGAEQSPRGSGSVRKALATIRSSRSTSPVRDDNAARHAELLGAIAGLADGLKDVKQRVTELEDYTSRGHEASDESDGSGGYSSDSSSRISSEQLSSDDDEGNGKSYVTVPRNLGHWNCKELEGNNDQQPHRYPLHGYEPFAGLQSTRSGGGGTIGLGLRWMEPACLYYKTGLGGLKNGLRRLDQLRDDVRAGGAPVTRDELADLRHELMASYNTLAGAFELANTYRTLLVERAKVLAPGAKRADKERAEWVEKVIDEEDYAAADAAADVRRLKADYDHEAHKADLRRAASKGGAAAGERSHRRDDDDRSGGKSKSQKRRERRERRRDDSRERSSTSRGGGGGGGSRVDSGGSARDGGGKHQSRRDDSRERAPRNGEGRRGGGAGKHRDRDDRGGRDDRRRAPSNDSRRGGGKGGGGGSRDAGKGGRGGGDARRDDRRDGGRRGGGHASDSDSDCSWS